MCVGDAPLCALAGCVGGMPLQQCQCEIPVPLLVCQDVSSQPQTSPATQTGGKTNTHVLLTQLKQEVTHTHVCSHSSNRR